MPRRDPLNQTRFWRNPALPGLCLLHADFSRHDYAPHTHDALVVAVTEDGGSEYRARGRTEEATPALLLVFNPNEPHSGRMGRSRRWHYRSFYVPAAGLAALGRACGCEAPPYFAASAYADPGLVAAFRALHHTLDCGGEPAAIDEAMITSFAALFTRHGALRGRLPGMPADRQLFARASALMRARHAEALTLEVVGDALGLTAFQLIGLFKRHAGLTPHAWLSQVRVVAALRHLQAGDPPAEAAARAGFYDQSAFNRHCRRIHGVTPLQYCRAVAA